MNAQISEIISAYKSGKLTSPEVKKMFQEQVAASVKEVPSSVPLSEGQKGLWALQKTFPEMTAYNVPLCFKVSNLDIQIFKQACQFLLKQHPILSSVIKEEIEGANDEVLYQINQALKVSIVQEEACLPLLSDQIAPYLNQKAREPFNLEKGPLIRIHLLSFDSSKKGLPQETVVLINVHHIVFDGSSALILMNTLFDAYQALLKGQKPIFKSVSTTYYDFVKEEQKMLQGKVGESYLSYWRQQLAGTLPNLTLPTDRTQRRNAGGKGKTFSCPIPPELSKKIKQFSQEQQAYLPTVFMGLFLLFLYKYTGQKDIIVGMPVNERNKFGGLPGRFDHLIGFLVNMVPIRSKFSNQESFLTFLEKLQKTMVNGMAHSYPFAALVRELRIPIGVHSPVFQVALEYQDFFKGQKNPGVPIQLIEGLYQAGEYDLVLEVMEKRVIDGFLEGTEQAHVPTKFDSCGKCEAARRSSSFILNWKYNPDLFDETTIVRMMEHCTTLIEEVISQPNGHLGDYSLLSKNEKKKLLFDWNQTEVDYPHDQSVHEIFEKQAMATPQSIAVFYGEQSLTYAELDKKSSTLAEYLQNQGVHANTLVAICVERSFDMLIGLLGILKAGGAYVPLDPDYPEERLKYILKDSQAKLILTHSQLEEKLLTIFKNQGDSFPLESKTGIVVLDEGGASVRQLNKQWAGIPKKESSHSAGSQDLAYVIYTSGSTGHPKGVMIPHQALTNFLFSMSLQPGLQRKDKLLAVTTYCFDIAGLELFLPLIKGAQCYIGDTPTIKDVEKLKSLIRKTKPTHIQATPSMWTILFHSGWQNEEKVKILCGGEALTESLHQHFIRTNSHAWNLFGPTETTIWSSIERLEKDKPITIGKPIANTKIYILNEQNQLAPIGVPGELCIAGDGLAKGYWAKPELTAEKFIDNPFKSEGGNHSLKLYRTGDLARWLPHGKIEHLGRLDFQVKIRGYRIELEEIENQLNHHDQIKECVVIVREYNVRHAEDSKQLVAYYIPTQVFPTQKTNSQEDFRAFLKKKLPEYMVPSFFIALDKIPLTPNGKVDRINLMNRNVILRNGSQTLESSTATTKVPPSVIENKVLAIWRDVLKVDDIDTMDGFFEVGGNSLSAVMLAEKISKMFQLSFTATTLFQYSNVRQISQYLGQREQTQLSAPVIKKEAPMPYPDYYQESCAIVGISCHFPGAKDHREFWQNLKNGIESSQFFSKKELDQANLPQEMIENPYYIPVQYAIEGKDLFDSEFFHLPSKNAVFMDPQFRLLLLHAWQAVEDAGYVSKEIPETSVFMSVSNSFYHSLLKDSEWSQKSDAYVAWVMAQGGTIPTMVSYQLGFRGPSVFVHSNCSSGLTALSLAYQNLQLNEAKYALVGAATLLPPSTLGYVYQPGLNFSSDGHCKTFDASADGMVSGEGVGVIMLKKALDAIEDGDHIYALLRGIGLNNDGSDKAGFYAPGVTGQSEVIQKVLTSTGIDPETIGYVEAHGTGTKLGDPIEVMALTNVYQKFTSKKQFCALGSVKPNIGHLDTVAGLAGCIKVALSLMSREIPPSINYSQPNSEIDFEPSPFYVVDHLKKWEGSVPFRAALSSFGIGGTNAHAIFEEYQGHLTSHKIMPHGCLVPLSAKTKEQTYAYAEKLLAFLKSPQPQPISLKDLSYTLQVGREAMKNRVIFLVQSIDELVESLNRFTVHRSRKRRTGSEESSKKAKNCFQGKAEKTMEEETQQALIQKWIAKGSLKKLAKFWVKGGHIDWKLLYSLPPTESPRRISLPTYPFALKQHWIEEEQPTASSNSETINKSDNRRQDNENSLEEEAIHFFKRTLSKVLKLPPLEIKANEPFETYGIDSMMVMDLTNELEKTFGPLSKTLFFEYQTIQEISQYFLESFRPQIVDVLKNQEADFRQLPTQKERPLESRSLDRSGRISLEKQQAARNSKMDLQSEASPLDIAVIGLAGRYPQSQNLEEYWQNLSEGRNCITEIPASRWNWRDFYSEDRSQPGHHYSKWGGFVADVDKFDPLFFNISPREAKFLDPQERLFLEQVWTALEDAGYTKESLQGDGSAHDDDLGRQVGVYVGVTYGEYQLFGAEENLQGNPIFTNGTYASIANRVSYFFNLHGPSMAIDTMCSSSLAAMHLACQDLKYGQTYLGIAGGVNLSIHPNKYRMLSMGHFLSNRGQCESFGVGGDGYIPGEGVGVALLKRLSDAERDEDPIYGIIKGSAVNHGGKTNGYTVPNPKAQRAVIAKAIKEAGIDPKTISYVEAHGTGTKLGDPIEITGLTQAFNLSEKGYQNCWIGSAKSNIGHCESAAGIAGVTKVLLQMKHRKIVPSLHSQVLNPNIDFSKTPFIVNQELRDWTQSLPHIAGVSSFGAGGSNAHMVIEEYASNNDNHKVIDPRHPVMIILSAKTLERLRVYVEKLLQSIKSDYYQKINLEDLAYTFQVGREAMDVRLGVIIDTWQELEEKLEDFLERSKVVENIFWEDDRSSVFLGQAKGNHDFLNLFDADEDMAKSIDAWLKKRKYKKLLNVWVKGVAIDWNKLYIANNFLNKPKRISAPTYPFAKERCWAEIKRKPSSSKDISIKRFEPADGRELIDREPPRPSVGVKRLILKPVWKEKRLQTDSRVEYSDHRVFLCGFSPKFSEQLRSQSLQNPEQQRPPHFIDLGRDVFKHYENVSGQLFRTIQEILQKKVKGNAVLIQVLVPAHGPDLVFSALSGLLKTAHMENPKIVGQVIAFDTEEGAKGVSAKLKENAQSPEDQEVRYRGTQRFVVAFDEFVPSAQGNQPSVPWKEGGVYLITGGAGGLGKIFAKEIARNTSANLILTGRSKLSDVEKNNLEVTISGQQSSGVNVEYWPVDVCDKKAVGTLIQKIKNQFGGLNGIIHSAGVIQDNFILKKTKIEFEQVLAPKVAGLMNLDQATKEMALDFFVLFSSGASVTGSVGQADYAVANAFMDAFSHFQSSQQRGRYLSINWLLWKEGGMQVDAATEERLRETMGIVPLETSSGIGAFYYALASNEAQVMVLEGHLKKLPAFFKHSLEQRSKSNPIQSPPQAQNPLLSNEGVEEKALNHFKKLLSSIINLPADRIDPNLPLEHYGLDSVMILEMKNELETSFGALPNTLLFNFRDIKALTNHFIEFYHDQFIKLLSGDQEAFLGSKPHDNASLPRTFYPLSCGQQSLFFLKELNPESFAYNMGGAIRIQSRLDTTLLREAFQVLIHRHSALRVTFFSKEGQFFQEVHDHPKLDFTEQRVWGLSLEEVRERANKAHKVPFNLEEGPLFRINLYQRDSEDYVLLITLFHIISDGWSFSRLLEELWQIYLAKRASMPVSLSPLKSEYSDFVHWQTNMLASETGEQHKQYWLKQLSGELPVLHLRTDYPRPPIQTNNGAIHSFELESELVDQLDVLSKQTGCTKYMVFLMAFQILIHRYSGQNDILVGSPTTGRTQKAFSDILGYFVNPVVLRSDFNGDPSVFDFLKQVRSTVLSALDHQDYPLVSIIEQLEFERDASRTPLFQVMFNYTKILGSSEFLRGEKGILLEPFRISQQAGQFDFGISLNEASTDLSGEIDYNTDLFNETTIIRMGEHYQAILQEIIKQPDQKISEISFLTQEEHCLMGSWNAQPQHQNERHEEASPCFHHLFEGRAKADPDSIAVVLYQSDDDLQKKSEICLTYQALNEKANQLGRYLQKLGVEKESLVGVCAERSLEMIIAVMAILKAGGAYLPIDPFLPKQRRDLMIDDAKVKVILTQAAFAKEFSEISLSVVYLDQEWGTISLEGKENLNSEVGPENLAYVIYTSGSTGRPKGTMVEHQSVSDLYYALQEVYRLGSTLKSFLQMANFSFDVFSGDLIRALASGGKLVLCPREFLLNPEPLYHLIVKENIDFAEFVPGVINHLMDYLERTEKDLKSMEMVIVGSDVFYSKDYRRIKRFLKWDARLINSYGATETTIDNFYFEGDPSASDKIVPIGRPLPNTKIYILDKHLQPVPLGVPGELFLGGTCVARGYLNRGELTKEKFIKNPFSKNPHDRLFRTKDLVYYQSDGAIHFIRRIDFQVKIRGYRVEVGEVESMLHQVPHVKEAVVVAKSNDAGTQYLVGYIVPANGKALEADQLRGFLKEKLPDYMIPSAFVMLKQMPFSSNGKLDRKALPPLDFDEMRTKAFVAPSTGLEKAIAQVWADVLGIKKVGRYDNFFEIGGDSLLSIKVISQLKDKNIHITPRLFILNDTIAKLASSLKEAKPIIAEQGQVVGKVSPLPIQRWFFEQSKEEMHHYNQAALLEVPFDVLSMLPAILKPLFDQHDALRMIVERNGEGVQLSIKEEIELKHIIQIEDLSLLDENERVNTIESLSNQFQGALDLAQAFIKVVFFNCGSNQKGRLLFIIHHLVVDFVSWGVLLEDFSQLYMQHKAGKLNQLPQKTSSYKAWSEKLMAYANSQKLLEELPYWTHLFLEPIAPLLVPNPSAQEIREHSKSYRFTLDQNETWKLLNNVPSSFQVEMNDILLAVLCFSYYQWTGGKSLLIHLEGHGREDLFDDIDLSRTVGWFTSLYPVLLKAESSLESTLVKTRDRLRAIPNKGIGFGILKYLSHSGKEALKNVPAPEVCFNYFSQFNQYVRENQVFKMAEESPGTPVSPRQKQEYVLEIDGLVVKNQFTLLFTYGKQYFKPNDIEKFASLYSENLKALIRLSAAPKSLTPPSFSPVKQLSSRALNSNHLIFFVPGIGQNIFDSVFIEKNLGEKFHLETLLPFKANSDEFKHTHLEALAQGYIEQIKAIQPQGPYSFLGYSWGGKVVVEIVRQLLLTEETFFFIGLIDAPNENNSFSAPSPHRQAIYLADSQRTKVFHLLSCLRERFGVTLCQSEQEVLQTNMLMMNNDALIDFLKKSVAWQEKETLDMSQSLLRLLNTIDASEIIYRDSSNLDFRPPKMTFFSIRKDDFDASSLGSQSSTNRSPASKNEKSSHEWPPQSHGLKNEATIDSWAAFKTNFEEVPIEANHQTILLEPHVQRITDRIKEKFKEKEQ